MELINLMDNAHVLIKDNTKYLFSYGTCIAQWWNGILFIIKNWEGYYCSSNSTNKHLYQFIRDYTCYDVHTKKDLLQLINNPNVLLVERL